MIRNWIDRLIESLPRVRSLKLRLECLHEEDTRRVEWLINHASDAWKAKVERLNTENEWLRSQLMQLRVSQHRTDRAGWMVGAFIPEEVLKLARGWNHETLNNFIKSVAIKLTRRAFNGARYIDQQGKVCALVFAPLCTDRKPDMPEYVQAVYDKGGEFTMSEKAWKTDLQEQRKGLGL